MSVVRTKALCTMVGQIKFAQASLSDALSKAEKFQNENQDIGLGRRVAIIKAYESYEQMLN